MQEHSCKWHEQCFTVNRSPSPALELGRGNGLLSLITNIHSYCALFLRQHGGPSEHLLLNPVAGGWDCCQYLQQHWHVFPLRTAWLKATCYTLSLTHIHTVANTHTRAQTITNPPTDTEAAIDLPSPPIVIWCELLLNLINHQTLSMTRSFR